MSLSESNTPVPSMSPHSLLSTPATRTCMLTGGLGFIGSATAVALLRAGWRVSILDNCVNADARTADDILRAAFHTLTISPEARARLRVLIGDVRDAVSVRRALRAWGETHPVDAVIHFAALKSVPDSFVHEKEYLDVNVNGTLTVAWEAADARVPTFVFSSSATVYGNGPGCARGCMETDVILDNDVTAARAVHTATSPYGMTKILCEHALLTDARLRAQQDMHIVLLRYFNPVGSAHPLLGERYWDTRNTSLFSACLRATMGGGGGGGDGDTTVGVPQPLTVFGTDYESEDGTAVRDFIHVSDVAEAHVAAAGVCWKASAGERDACKMADIEGGKGERVGRACPSSCSGWEVINIGRGFGTTVGRVLRSFEEAGLSVPHIMGERRAGDIPILFCDASHAAHVLHGWRATRTLDDACRDAIAYAHTVTMHKEV